MVGFGSVGRGTLPLLLRHIDLKPEQISIITADHDGLGIAREYGVAIEVLPITRENYLAVLDARLRPGDFLLNVSFDVSSLALIEYCQARGILYLDAAIEPWPGGHTDTTRSASERSNYAFREAALALRAKHPQGPTAVLTHGANPGLVSHLFKQALLNIAADTGLLVPEPACREDWARLAARLGVKVVHVAERDTQIPATRKRADEFVNTWSPEAFAGEGMQPAELGWGTHERHFPPDGARHPFGCGAAIYLKRPGLATRIRTWTPLAGPFHAFLVTHAESISIPDYFTVREGDQVVYRPTVHYAYHPCDDAVLSVMELAGRNWRLQSRRRLIVDEIVEGRDELGVLLMGHAKGAYWYGSRLSIEEARALCPHNNATSLQVNAPVMAAVVWAMRHPAAGIVEPDELPFREVLDPCLPYLGEVVGVYGDWTPLADRGRLFEEDLDTDDPWQFKNFRVT